MKKLFTYLFFTVIMAMSFAMSASAQVDVASTGGTPTASYTTLKGAFDAINAGTHTLVITIGISGNTTETDSAVINASGTGSALFSSIVINPTGGAARTITGAITGPLIYLNGADNVTIDGLNTGGNSLTVSNTATGVSSTVKFMNDASYNFLQNCTILGSTTSYGVVYFSTGTVTGNDSNTVNFCNIGPAGTNRPLTGIWSLATSTAIDNAYMSVTNNNIYDYFSATAATRGINLQTGNTNWTITNNRLYQTATRIYTTAATHYGINIVSGSGYTVTGNVIGFANSSGTGTTNLVGNTVALTGTFPSAYTTTGTANATRYTAINCNFTAGGTVSNIQGNTIAGFALYTSSGATTANGIFCGISIIAGNVNVGTTSGNTIGATTGQSSIYVATTTAAGVVVGIYSTTINTVTIKNNNIGAIDAVGTLATNCGAFMGIDAEGIGAVYDISNNNIGNATADNIRNGYTLSGTSLSNAGILTTTTGTGVLNGIYTTGSGATCRTSLNTLRGWATSTTGGINIFGIQNKGGCATSITADSNSFGTSATGWIRFAFASASNLYGIQINPSAFITYNNFSIQNNDFQGITYSVVSTGTVTLLSASVVTSNGQALNNCAINNNTFTNLNLNITTGSITFITTSYNVLAGGIENVNGNSIVGTFNKSGAGGAIWIMNDGAGSVPTAVINVTNNNFSNITVAGSTAIYGIYNSNGATPGPNKSFTGNTFSNWTCATGAILVISVDYGGSNGGNGNYIYNNTISNITTTTGAITGIVTNSFGGGNTELYTVAGNTISGFTSTSGAIIGIKTVSGTGMKANVYSNNISNLKTTTTGTIVGISSASATANIYSNTITGLQNTGTGASIYGITASGSPSIVYSNTINTFTSASTTAIVAGISVSAATSNVYLNKIYTLSNVGSATGVTNGIMITSASTQSKVYRNKIYDLTTSGAFSTTPGVNGVVISGGTSVLAYNNLVGDLKAPASTSPDAIRGISVTSTTASTTYGIYYNTVYMTGTSSGTGFGTTGIYHTASTSPTTATLDLRNNIIANNCTPTGSGLVVAFRRSAGTTGMLFNYASTSNFNDFYAGTPGANNLIYNDGTSSAILLNDFKTGVYPAGTVANRDSVSVTENPIFLSTTGTDANFLHINSATASQLESGGATIATYTSDFDSTARYPNTGYPLNPTYPPTSPDIGAVEFGGIPLKVNPPLIVYTPFLNTASVTSRTIVATITSVNGIPVSGTGMPTLYFKINAGSYTQVVSTIYATNQYQFVLSGTFNPGDTVSYYFVAQDNALPPNVIASPSAGASGYAANPPSASVPPTTPNIYYIVTQPALTGDYTVGLTLYNKISGRNISFAKVVSKVMKEVPVTETEQGVKDNGTSESGFAVNSKGKKELREVDEVKWVPMENGREYTDDLFIKKSENPNFSYPAGVNGIYASITAAVNDLNLRGVSGNTRFLLNDAVDSTETFPITVNVGNANLPGSSATVTIKPNTGVIASVSGSSTSTMFKIFNTNYVTIDGSNTMNGTTRDLTITNNSVTTPSVIWIGSYLTTPITNTVVKNCNLINGVNTSSAFIISEGTVLGNPGYFNNITVQNNTIQRAYYGIYAIGSVLTGNGSGTLITGNDLNVAGTNSIRIGGIYAQGLNSVTVSNNNIGNILNANLESPKGIWFATGTNSGTISGNNITTLSLTNVGAAALTGIYVTPGSTATSISVTNNTVSAFSNSGTAATFAGIYTTSPNTSVTGNTVSGLTQLGAAAYWGIFQTATVNASCSNNTVSGLTTATTGISTGINILGVSTGVTVSKNKVYNIKQTNATGYTAVGLALASSSSVSNIVVSNNLIYDVTGNGFASQTISNGYGINISSGAGYKLYYNTINLATNQTLATGVPACLLIGSTVTIANALDIRNNIFSIPATIGTNRYAVLCNAVSTVFQYINNNDYYTSGANVGYIGATNRADLTAWKTGTGKDSLSVSGDPRFVSATDLHIINYVPSPVNDAGTPVSIITDYDGNTRDAVMPDIGAYEYAPLAPTLVSPVSNSTANNLSLNLVWTKPIGAIAYNLIVATDAGFTNIIKQDTTLTDSLYTVSNLNMLTTYYWKVSANIYGWGAFSRTSNFKTIGSPTGVVLNLPADNAINQPTTVTCSWYKAADQTFQKNKAKGNSPESGPLAVSNYWLEYSVDSSFATGVTVDSTLTDTTKVLAGLNNLTHYYWRVKAKNQAGWNAYGTKWSFTTIISSPGAPSLISPINNAASLPLSLDLSWNKINTADFYNVQVSTNPGFTNIVVNDSASVDTVKSISGLNLLTNYYWRVRSYNVSGWSAFSNSWTFKTLGTATQVVLSSPLNGAINEPLTLTCNWFKAVDMTNKLTTINGKNGKTNNGKTDNGQRTRNNYDSPLAVSSYWFEYGTDSTFATVLFRDSTLTDTTKILSGLSYSARYYWRVKASNQIGWGAFSSNWYFTTAPDIPAVPTLVSPANNSVDLSVVPALDWNDAAYAANYRLQISISPAFTPIAYDTTGVVLSQITVPSGKLTTNKQYYWRVSATNYTGTSGYSTVWNFTTAPNSPNVPVLSAPSNGATGQPTTLSFNWFKAVETMLDNKTNNGQRTTNKGDSPDGISKYWFEYGTDSTLATFIARDSSLTDTTKTLTGLANYSVYYWRAKAKNQTGWSGFSAIWKFTTLLPVPAAPVLVSPATNTTGSTLIPDLTWRKVTYAVSYKVQVSADSLFTTSLLDTIGVLDTTFTLAAGKLTGMTKYFWRVSAVNASGAGVWSSVWNFKTLQNLTLNLKVLLEGFWNGSNQVSDSVTVYLANSTAPYAFTDSAKLVLSTSGTCSPNFTKATNGNYYIVIKHRNHLETWSKLAKSFVTNVAVTYDFSTAATQAFGDNMKQVGSVWVLFGGDANKDGSIDANDIGIFITEFGSLGYLRSDFNGDQDVNASDVLIISNNFGLIKIVPGGEPLAPETNKNKKMQFENTIKSGKDVQKPVNKSNTEAENKNNKSNK
ncbi:MAG: hypothetical protein NTY74_01855 [Ignavibacteriae bacterium]|nr:hypothetical protein [Ignavibacteriota bacterium]